MIDTEDNPFLVSDTKATPERVIALSYVITTTRTLDAQRKKVYTHGIGIELDLKPGETRQVLLGGSEGGLGNRGQGGGTGAVARWNTSGESREDVVKERLDRWVELNGGYEYEVSVMCLFCLLFMQAVQVAQLSIASVI